MTAQYFVIDGNADLLSKAQGFLDARHAFEAVTLSGKLDAECHHARVMMEKYGRLSQGLGFGAGFFTAGQAGKAVAMAVDGVGRDIVLCLPAGFKLAEVMGVTPISTGDLQNMMKNADQLSAKSAVRAH